MTSASLRRWFVLSHVSVAVAVAIAVAAGAFAWVQGTARRTASADLVALARSLAGRLDGATDLPAVDRLVAAFRGREHRVTVYGADGHVLADLHRDPAGGPRPFREFDEVLESERAVSGTARAAGGTAFAAAPLLAGGDAVGVLRVSRTTPHAPLDGARWLALVVLAGILGGVIGILSSARIASSLRALEGSLDRMADGDAQHRASASGTREIDRLRDAINRSTLRWRERVEGERRRNDEHAAILTSVREGVVAIDTEERVLSLNRAAGELLDVDVDASVGRPVHEVFRDLDVQRFARHALNATGPVTADVSLGGARGERALRGSGVRLRSTSGELWGAVIVLEDVTRSKRLERLRQEFVANVSHELRTPLTTIKGSLETLRDLVTTPDAERFAGMAIRQAERLHAIVEDLLTLSRIESRSGQDFEGLEPGPVRAAIDGAVSLCAPKGAERNVRIEVTGDVDATVPRNPRLLEQALVNLLDNAIQYSADGGRVVVAVAASPDTVQISVIDRGTGIAPEHHDRLFERFFTVDRARSRQAGGTGLGLAIVKHIALAHGGGVGVESRPGAGSTFWISLPRRASTPAPNDAVTLS